MTDKYQGGIEVLVILLDVVGIILGHLPLVHCVEVDAGNISLDGLEERSQGALGGGEASSPDVHRSSIPSSSSYADSGVGVNLES